MLTDVARNCLLAKLLNGILLFSAILDRIATVDLEGPEALGLAARMGVTISENQPEKPWAYTAWNDVMVARVSFTGAPGLRLFIPSDQKPRVMEQLQKAGASEASLDAARAVRLEHFKPRFGEDIFTTTLTQEAQQMHAVNFNKGCYIGQEIVERVGGVSTIAAHVAACRDGKLRCPPAGFGLSAASESPMQRFGKAIVFARRTVRIEEPFVRWAMERGWPAAYYLAADIPHPSETIAAGRPVLTVFGESSARECQEQLRRRVGEVEDRLYGFS